MKIIKKRIVLVFFLGFATRCLANAEVDVSGELNLVASVKNLPTRDQGTTAFEIPSLKLFMQAPLKDRNEIFVELEAAASRGSTGHFETTAKQAYLSLASFLPEGDELRYGLVPDDYIERHNELWDFYFWGPSSDVSLQKYGYISSADLGLTFRAHFPDDWGAWSFSVTNGEGLASDEVGPRKQGQVLLSLSKLSPLQLIVLYSYGAYEAYDASFNKRTRLLLNLGYEFSKGFLALEYFATEDPADALSQGAGADGVDVVALHGTNIRGQGASLLVRGDLSQESSLVLRADWLNPVKEDRKKQLVAWTAGISYDTSEDLRWLFAYEHTDYSESYAAALRDKSRIVLATRARF